MNHAICFLLQWSLSYCSSDDLKKVEHPPTTFLHQPFLPLWCFAVWLRCAPSTRRRPWLQIHPASGTPFHFRDRQHMEEKNQLRFRYHDLLSDKTCGFLQLGCAFSQALFTLSPPHTRGAAKTPKAWNFLFLTIHLLLGIIISAFRQVLNWWYSYFRLLLVFAWL